MFTDAAVAAIDTAVERELERARQPGLALGLTNRDGTLALRTYGVAELASKRPVTADTLFEIGSIGKTFTAVAMMQLVDEGRIDLHEPFNRYLPWFAVPQPAGHSPITAAHLLSHTAGIVAGIDGTAEAAFQVWSLRDLPTFSAPGQRFHYSNVGYKALGLALEAIEGRPYPEVIRTRVLEPLEMSMTEPAITHDIRSRLAVGYEYLYDDRFNGPGAPLAPATWLETDTADGSIASTAEDMCAFVRMLMRGGAGPNGRLLSEEAFAEMSTGNLWEDGSVAYGYGLVMRDLDGRRFIGHGGGMVGYLAAMQADTDANLGVIVLQNGVGTNPMALARTAIKIADGETEATDAVPSAEHDELAGLYEPLEALPEPSPELQAIEGHYRSHNPWTTNFRVVLRGDRPWLVFAAAPDGFDTEQPLIAAEGGSFRVGEDPGNPEVLRFDTVIDGRALRAWLSGWPYYRANERTER